MEVRKITESEYLSTIGSTNITPFHNVWWLKSLESYSSRFKVDFWGISKDDAFVAVLPVLTYKILGLSIVRNYLTPYLGPIFSNDVFRGKQVSVVSRVKEINAVFADVLKSYRFVLHYPFSPWHRDLQPYKWVGFRIGVKYTYVIDLSVPLNKIWETMESSRRRDIRKAERLNPVIIEDDIDNFVELNSMTFERQGKKYDLKRLWRLLFEECSKREMCRVWTAYVNKEPLASIFLVWDKERAYYIGGGINGDSRGTMSLLMWNAIKFSKEKGLKVFDFEGSDVPSIEGYFRKFGGEIIPVFYVQSKLAAVITK